MCEFCDNQEQKLIPEEDLGFIKEMLADGNETSAYCSVYLENDELYFDSSCNEYPHSKVKINFCPICGRDLRSKENDKN
jgi:hypothetical protein